MAAGGAPAGGRLFQGVEKASAAFRLMQQMGWEEGSGLGKNKQGIATHVRVTKKHDNAGLGIAEAKKAGSDWTVNTAVYDNILKNLNVQAAGQYQKKAVEDSSESDSDSEVEDIEPDKKSEVSTTPAITKPVKLARPQGRYKRREAGKQVASYSSTDLSAILGHGATSSPTPPKEIAKVLKANSEELPPKNENVALLSEIKPATPSLLGRQLTASVSKPSPAWWGSKFGFVRAGELGSMPVPQSDVTTAGKVHLSKTGDGGVTDKTMESGETGRRPAFDEQDQENLYNLVQDNATSGRRGLGIGDAPKKVAGARWQGSKVTFGDVSDEEGEADGKGEAMESPDCVDPAKGIAEGSGCGDEDLKKQKSKKKRKVNEGNVEEGLKGSTRDEDGSLIISETADVREVGNASVQGKKKKVSKKKMMEEDAGPEIRVAEDVDRGKETGQINESSVEVEQNQNLQGRKRKSAEGCQDSAGHEHIAGEGPKLNGKKSKKEKVKGQLAIEKEKRSLGNVETRSEGIAPIEETDRCNAKPNAGEEVLDGEEVGNKGKKKKRKVQTSGEESGVVLLGRPTKEEDSTIEMAVRGAAKGAEKIIDHSPNMKLKWKKLITASLKQGPVQGMKLKKLQLEVLAAAALHLGSTPPAKAELVASFREALNAETRFVLEGHLVRMKTRGGAAD